MDTLTSWILRLGSPVNMLKANPVSSLVFSFFTHTPWSFLVSLTVSFSRAGAGEPSP